MKKFNQTLAIVLVAQVALAGLLIVMNAGSSGLGKAQSMLTFDKNKVDEIVITGEDKKLVTLRKTDKGWQLPDYKNLPVDAGKYNQLINKAMAMSASWPVSTTKSSVKRFEVAEDKFQRKIVFKHTGNVLDEIYLGTSPGFRKVHFRKQGQQEVYAVEFSNFNAPVNNDDWLDTALLQPQGEMNKITGKDFNLEKKDSTWLLNGLAKNEQTKKSEADNLATQIRNLQVTKLVTDEEKTKIGTLKPTFQLTIDVKNKMQTYQFFKEGDSLYVKHSDSDHYFHVAKFSADKLAEINRASLVIQIDSVAEKQDETSGN